MGNVKQNAYHVKFKLIPKQEGYKTSFIQGIIFDDTPAKAEKRGLKKLSEFLLKEIGVEIKTQSIVKLRKDFMIHPESGENENN